LSGGHQGRKRIRRKAVTTKQLASFHSRIGANQGEAGERGTRQIAWLFEQVGMPVPKTVRMGPGQDLAEFLLAQSQGP
jgi:hypothetical protein